MFDFIKHIKRRKRLTREFKHDKDGNALVEIGIKDKSEVLAPFALDGKETINVEFANVLDNVSKSIPPKENMHLKLQCEKLTEKEKEDFSMAIKNHYLNSLIDNQRKLRHNILLFWSMIAISVLFLAILFIANHFGAPWIVTEVLDIIAWLFVWEAIDLLAFQRSLYQYEMNRDLVLYKMNISFE